MGLSVPVSWWTFGSRDFATPVSLLALAVLLRLISDGQMALIQGMRRIADLARISVLAAVVATSATLVLIYWLRERGVVPSLICTAAITLGCAWYFRRNISIPAAALTAAHVRERGRAAA